MSGALRSGKLSSGSLPRDDWPVDGKKSAIIEFRENYSAGGITGSMLVYD